MTWFSALPTPDWISHDESCVLYRGDCLEILPSLDKVDAVVTDPPYGMGNDTDSRRFSGGHLESQIKRGRGGRFNGTIIGDNTAFNPTPFVIYPQVILWGANHYAATLPKGTTLIWIKRLDDAFETFLSDAEMAWMKGGYGIYCRRDLTMQGEANNRVHPNQKPIGIMQWCVEKTSGIVLDPYCGSGTTGVACARLGRRFIGIEIEPKYFEIAVKRIEAELKQERLFKEPIKPAEQGDLL